MELAVQLLVVSTALFVAVDGQTLVQFSPDASHSQHLPVAAGFAYAFHAPVSAKSFDHSSPRLSAFEPQKSVVVTKEIKTVPVLKKSVAKKPLVAKKIIAPKVLKTQYHSQDELGQYAYGYVHNDASHHEERTADGGVTGRYSYYDQLGNKQSAKYVADKNGYRVEATNLYQETPLPVEQTPEVRAATQAHLLAVQNAKARSLIPNYFDLGDTPEVAAAKAAHLKAYNEISRRHSGRGKRSAHKVDAYRQRNHYQVPVVNPFVPVQPTLAVQKATHEHLKAKKAAYKYGGAVHVGIQESPEVAAARDAHLYTFQKIAEQQASIWKRSAHRPQFYRQRYHHSPASSYHSPHVPVGPTPAVQQATYEHLKAKEAAHKYGAVVHLGVKDTPAVTAARNAHIHAYNQIARDHASRWKRSTNWGAAGYGQVPGDDGLYRNDGREQYFDDGSYRPEHHYGAGSLTPDGTNAQVTAYTSGVGFVNAYQKPVAPYVPVIPGVPTPAVQAATQDHLQAKHETFVYGSHAHRGVQDTPEVAYAKLAHQQAFQQIANEHGKRWKRSTWGVTHNDGQYRDDYREQQFDDGSYRADQHYSPGDDGTYRPSHHFGVNTYSTSEQAPYQHLQPVVPSHQAPVKRWKREAHIDPFAHTHSTYHNSGYVKNTPVKIVKQYHAQDELGQYEYGYKGGPSEKHEEKGADGVTRGHYSYLDPYGNIQRVHYEADDYTGFKIISATNLP